MKRTKLYIISFCLLSLTAAVNAQTAVRADALFVEKNYAEAAHAYRSLLGRVPDNQLYLYRYARCQQELGQTDTAIVYFEKAGEKYQLRNYYLGLLYEQSYRFEQALTLLSRYALTLTEDTLREQELKQHIAYCRKGARYIRRVEDICIIDSVTLPLSRLLTAYRLSAECGSLTLADSLLPCYVTQKGDHSVCVKRVGQNLKLLSCHRILSADECDTLPNAVNSDANQSYPFMLTDGVTLYFASDKAEGLGGYDIYVTRYNHATKDWFEPENIGFPFNSSANDFLYAEDELSGIGYFATDRFAQDGYATVYSFELNPEKRVVTDSLRAIKLAQLSHPTFCQISDEERLADGDIQNNSKPRKDYTVTDEQPLAVINDELTYYSLTEFRSPKARKLCEQVILLDEAISEEKENLLRARIEYEKLGQDEELRSVILASERTLVNMIADREQLMLQVRQEEQLMLNRNNK